MQAKIPHRRHYCPRRGRGSSANLSTRLFRSPSPQRNAADTGGLVRAFRKAASALPSFQLAKAVGPHPHSVPPSSH